MSKARNPPLELFARRDRNHRVGTRVPGAHLRNINDHGGHKKSMAKRVRGCLYPASLRPPVNPRARPRMRRNNHDRRFKRQIKARRFCRENKTTAGREGQNGVFIRPDSASDHTSASALPNKTLITLDSFRFAKQLASRSSINNALASHSKTPDREMSSARRCVRNS